MTALKFVAAPAIFCRAEQSVGLSNYTKIIIWFLLSTALIYHLFAGIRHLIMDAGFGEEKHIARITAYLVFVTALLSSVFIRFTLMLSTATSFGRSGFKISSSQGSPPLF